MKLERLLFSIMIVGAGSAAACGSSEDGRQGASGGAGADAGTAAGAGGSAAGTGAGAANGGGAGGGSGGSDASVGGSSGGGGTAAVGGVGTGADGGLPPPVIGCGLLGDSCASGADCCSAECDTATGLCTSSLTTCRTEGQSCSGPTDCCTTACMNGTCQDACVSDGAACTSDGECCGQSCTSGACAALNPACKISGNTCGADTECCSGYCKDGTCDLRASFCIQEGDICGNAADCCTGRCDIASGATVGLCGPPPTGASFCNDGVEGSRCTGCNECCSRLCAPYGPTGVKVCQPASGCHVTGDFCRETNDCCGADGTGLPGDGNVTCQIEPDSVIGVCRNPLSCNPQGNVCHYQNYVCDISSARANCCGGLGAIGGICQLDTLGVPRCNGLGDECRQPGETCASADDCCNDVPCIPGPDGVLICMTPSDGGVSCVPVTGACTIDADCCPGGTCNRPVGSTQGTCAPVTPPPPPPVDGGSGGAGSGGAGSGGGPGACSLYGQQCSAGGDCCNGVPCTDGTCRLPPG